MYKKNFNISNDLLCLANSDRYFISIDPSFSKILGYTIDELTSRPYIDFVHPQDIEKKKIAATKQNTGSELNSFENRYKHKDGSYITLSWSSTIDLEENIIYAMTRDVMHLRHTESRLKQISQSLRYHSIIALTDPDGIITEVNKNFCNISGYTQEELLGKTHRIVN
jgi:PAS domain S-box-containing protein